MNQHPSSAPKIIGYIHESTFALNLGFFFMALVFQYASQSVISLLDRLEFAVNQLLHIRQTDLITGHWEFFLPGITVALCIWVSLRLSSRVRLTQRILRSVAGVAALGTAPIWWLCASYLHTGGGGSLFGAIQFYELAIALCCIMLYLCGKWPVPRWGSILIVLLHHTFWLWQFGPYHIFLFFFSWQILPIAGFCSSLAWMVYLTSLERRVLPMRT